MSGYKLLSSCYDVDIHCSSFKSRQNTAVIFPDILVAVALVV